MPKITLFIAAVALAGCASTRQERAAAFQRELPRLVAACNGWNDRDPRLDGRDSVEACERLALNKSLGLADPVTVSAYVRYRAGALRPHPLPPTPTYIPAPLPQVQ